MNEKDLKFYLYFEKHYGPLLKRINQLERMCTISPFKKGPGSYDSLKRYERLEKSIPSHIAQLLKTYKSYALTSSKISSTNNFTQKQYKTYVSSPNSFPVLEKDCNNSKNISAEEIEKINIFCDSLKAEYPNEFSEFKSSSIATNISSNFSKDSIPEEIQNKILSLCFLASVFLMIDYKLVEDVINALVYILDYESTNLTRLKNTIEYIDFLKKMIIILKTCK